MRKCIFFILLTLTFWSCKKDKEIIQEVPDNSTPTISGNVAINITNVAGGVPLVLNTQNYINANQDTFSVSVFKYYISNIKLFRLDGFIFTEPESYRIVNHDDTSSCKFTIQNVPIGDYIGVEFVIGVDSLRNCDGAQSGALDPVHDMFWSWSQGYIFAKIEGKQKGALGTFFHHIGGFSAPNNAIVKSTPAFSTGMLQITADHTSKIIMKADILEAFKTPSIIDLASYSSVTMGKKAKEVATNYSDMFTVTSIQN